MKRKITLQHGSPDRAGLEENRPDRERRAFPGLDMPLAITLVPAYTAAGLALWSGVHWTAALALLPGIGTVALPAISLLLLALALRKQP